MLFNNARIYSFNKPVDASFLSILEDRLPNKVFLPCTSSMLSSVGWVSPISDGYLTKTVLRNSTMICMRIDEKVMPSSVIRSMVDEKAKSIEKTQARKVRKRERDSIRDEIIHEMLPRAFIKKTLVQAYIDIEHDIIVVNAASSKMAEKLLVFLRATLGSLPVQPFSVNARPTTFMTEWMTMFNKLPFNMRLGESCVLKDPMEDGGKVSCTNIDLESDEVKEHLNAGMQVDRLAISFNNSMTFKLESDLSLKSIRFTDEIKEKYGEDVEDEISRFDADLFMQSTIIRLFVDELESNYGKAELKEGEA